MKILRGQFEIKLHESESEVAQSCPTLCDPMDCSLLGSFVFGDSPGKSTRVVCHFLLEGNFLTQGSNLCLLNLGCDYIKYFKHEPSDHKISLKVKLQQRFFFIL